MQSLNDMNNLNKALNDAYHSHVAHSREPILSEGQESNSGDDPNHLK
jgi:hypothetical protein